MKTTARIQIQSHAELIKVGSRLNQAIDRDERLATMLMIDPVSALQEAGFELSDEMINHVRSRMDDVRVTEGPPVLFKRAKQGEVRLPWVDRVVFGDLDEGESGGGP